MGLSRYIRAGVTVRAIGHEMIVPTIGVTLPPDLATRLPERDHELEDVAGDRVLRSAHGGFRGPRPAPAVRRVWRRPREEPHQKRAILFIDDARVSPVIQVRLKICGQSQASPRLGSRGSAFVTVASKVSRDHLTELKGASSRPSIASGL